MARLPVVASNVPEMKRVVNDKQIGIVLDEMTAGSLSRAFDVLSGMEKVLAENLGRAAAEFSWGDQEKAMIRAYKTYVFNQNSAAKTLC